MEGETNLVDVLENTVKKHGNQIAIKFPLSESGFYGIKYSEFYSLIQETEQQLLKHLSHIKKG